MFSEHIRDRTMSNGFQVLIIEDSEEMLWVIGNVLETAGLAVEAVTNGKDAMEIIKNHPEIRLILLNYVLPDHCGLSIFEEIKTLGCRAEVIGISALGETRSAFLEKGAYAFLEKPFDIRELVELCRQAINGGRRAVDLALFK